MTPMFSRRSLLRGWIAASAAGLAAPALAQEERPETPACGDADAVTLAQTEGPYFTSRSPLKRDFRSDVGQGQPFTLVGFVLTTGCRPVAGAVVDLWHADSAGGYDNSGFRLRGHQLTDEQGRYAFETIMPGRYTGRTRHYHVKVQAPRGRVLTTQLYFPGEPGNARDRIFDERLLMDVAPRREGAVGRFDFVLGA